MSHPIIESSQEGHTDIVQSLLDRGVDPNIRDKDGMTALMMTSIEAYDDIARLLLDYGADPNITNNDGWTALMMASFMGNNDIIGLLLNNDADPDITDNNDGYTALILAESEGHDDVVRLIRDHINLQKAKQKLAFMSSLNSRLGYDTPLQNLDYDGITRLMRNVRKYDSSVNRRMRDEERVNPYTEWLQDFGQYGSGKRSSKKRSGKRKRKYYTKKRF